MKQLYRAVLKLVTLIVLLLGLGVSARAAGEVGPVGDSPGLKPDATANHLTIAIQSEPGANPGGTPEGNIVVYINWDGFAHYYVELAEQQQKIPNLSRIKRTEGVYFPNAYTSIPSVTNPMQVAIASGTTPRYTDNHYRYFDKQKNMVIQEAPARKNEAETLAEAAVRQNLQVISINQFAFENRGTVAGDPAKAYINTAEGPNGYSDAMARFDEAIRLVKTRQAGDLAFKQIPQLIALYMDDLDGIGHNEAAKYGLSTVADEAARRQAVIERLALMDAKLGEFILACQAVGIYDRMSFVLTTDHGMAPFGLQQAESADSKQTKLYDLISTIEALGSGFKCTVLHPGGVTTPGPDSDLALVTVGLQVQISYIGQFDPEVIRAKNAKVMAALKNRPYVGNMIEGDALAARGVKAGFADLVVAPRPPYHFHRAAARSMVARGQHDSLAEEAQRIASFMWGKDVKAGYIYQDTVYNYDFIPTIANLLKINAPLDTTGGVLANALTNAVALPEIGVKREDDTASINDPAWRISDPDASGASATSLVGPMAALEFAQVPAAQKMVVQYQAPDSGKLALYVNNRFVREIFFPANNALVGKYDSKTINLTLGEGDNVKLVNEPERQCLGLTIDCIVFYQSAPPTAKDRVTTEAEQP